MSNRWIVLALLAGCNAQPLAANPIEQRGCPAETHAVRIWSPEYHWPYIVCVPFALVDALRAPAPSVTR